MTDMLAKHNAAKLAKADPWNPDCPSREIIDVIASKWVLLLMPPLRGGPLRNGNLLRKVPGISQKVLTQTLRDLEARGLIYRRDYSELPPKVEYGLTALGRSLAQILIALDDWVIRHYSAMQRASEGGRRDGKKKS